MTQQTLTSARYIANIKTKATLTDGAATQGMSFFDIKNNFLYGCIPELSTLQKVDISVANNPVVTSSAPITPELGGVQQVALDDDGEFGYCINFNQTRLNSVKLLGELPPVAITSASDGGGGEVLLATTGTSNAAIGHPIILDMDVGSYSGEFTVSSKTATTIGILTPFVSTSVGTWTIPDGTPFLVATDNASYSGTMQIRYIDNKAVITNKTSGIVSITDVSDPSTLPAPFEVFVTGAEGLAVKGRYAAITNAATGAITIVDIVDYIAVDSVTASNLIGMTAIEWFEVGGVSYVLGYGQTNGYIICFEVLEDGAIGVSPVFEIQNDLYKLTKSVSLISNQYAISASAGATGVVVTDISDFNNVKIVKKYADDTNLNIASDIMLYGSRPFVSNRTTQTLSELDASQTHQSIAQIDVLEADNVKINKSLVFNNQTVATIPHETVIIYNNDEMPTQLLKNMTYKVKSSFRLTKNITMQAGSFLVFDGIHTITVATAVMGSVFTCLGDAEIKNANIINESGTKICIELSGSSLADEQVVDNCKILGFDSGTYGIGGAVHQSGSSVCRITRSILENSGETTFASVGALAVSFINTTEFINDDVAANRSLIYINNSTLGSHGMASNRFGASATEFVFDLTDTAGTNSFLINDNSATIGGEYFRSDTSQLTEESNEVIAKDNVATISSNAIGETTLSTDETVTINTAGVYEVIAGGNWVKNAISERVTIDANGLMTYNASTPVKVIIQALGTVEKSGGGTDTMSIGIFYNGSKIGFSTASETNTKGSSQSNASVTLSATNTLQLAVTNETSTTSVIVTGSLIFKA